MLDLLESLFWANLKIAIVPHKRKGGGWEGEKAKFLLKFNAYMGKGLGKDSALGRFPEAEETAVTVLPYFARGYEGGNHEMAVKKVIKKKTKR